MDRGDLPGPPPSTAALRQLARAELGRLAHALQRGSKTERELFEYQSGNSEAAAIAEVGLEISCGAGARRAPRKISRLKKIDRVAEHRWFAEQWSRDPFLRAGGASEVSTRGRARTLVADRDRAVGMGRHVLERARAREEWKTRFAEIGGARVDEERWRGRDEAQKGKKRNDRLGLGALGETLPWELRFDAEGCPPRATSTCQDPGPDAQDFDNRMASHAQAGPRPTSFEDLVELRSLSHDEGSNGASAETQTRLCSEIQRLSRPYLRAHLATLDERDRLGPWVAAEASEPWARSEAALGSAVDDASALLWPDAACGEDGNLAGEHPQNLEVVHPTGPCVSTSVTDSSLRIPPPGLSLDARLARLEVFYEQRDHAASKVAACGGGPPWTARRAPFPHCMSAGAHSSARFSAPAQAPTQSFSRHVPIEGAEVWETYDVVFEEAAPIKKKPAWR